MWLFHNLIEHIPISKYVLIDVEHILVFLRKKSKKESAIMTLMEKMLILH